MTSYKQEALQKLDKALKTDEHPPGRETFGRLKDLEETVRKIASEEEKQRLDQLEEPKFLEADIDRTQKFSNHLEVLLEILNEHGYYNLGDE